MSAHRPLPRGTRTCPPGGARLPEIRSEERNTARDPGPRRERVRVMALALTGLLTFIALPPALVLPSGAVELVATGVLTLLGCVLVALICHEIARR